MKKPNERLRYYRLLHGLTQQDVADRLYDLCCQEGRKSGINSDTVSKWERGRSIPESQYRTKLCALFGKDAQELGLVKELEPVHTNTPLPLAPTSTDTLAVAIQIQQHSGDESGIIKIGRSVEHNQAEGEEAMDRRDALKVIGAVGAGLLLTPHELLTPQPWERLSRTLARTSFVDETALSSLEQITKNYWQLRNTLGYRALLNGLLGHLETITQLLQCSQPSLIHKRLCSIASETAQYVGATLFDINEYVTARAYYKVSIEAAQEAEHYTLWAMGLGRMSFLPIYTSRAQDALPLLYEAQRLAEQYSTSTIRAWLASVEGEAYAHLHDTHASLLALVRAEHMLEQVKPGENSYGVQFDYARFVGYKGVCHLRLQQPKAAIAALHEAANLIQSSSRRQRSIILADAACAYGQLGEVDEACKFASQALTMNIQTKSELATQRIHLFRKSMKPWAAMSSVKEFDEQLAMKGMLIP